MSKALLLLLIAVVLAQIIYSAHVETHSFEPPFTEVDVSGSRMVNKHWRSSGVAAISQNFVRLTPDRQSKRGALWSRKALGLDAFTSTLKFRISGQGKQFFGDGIAMWIVNNAYYVEGDLHGNQEKFVGIGIIFDTYKNTENFANHRDVTVLINDGEKTYEMMTEDVIGCNSQFRFHNERADFTHSDSSRAQLLITESTLKLNIDSKNTGLYLPPPPPPFVTLTILLISR
jgi:lectin, mannose-binding 2